MSYDPEKMSLEEAKSQVLQKFENEIEAANQATAMIKEALLKLKETPHA